MAQIAAKTIVVIVNVIFIIIGIIIMSLGAWGIEKSDELQNKSAVLKDIPIRSIMVMVTVVGVFIIVTCLMGIIGALKRIRKMLTCYALFLFVLSIMELALGIGILAFNLADQADKFVEDEWFRETPNQGERIQAVQTFLDCCGWANADDSGYIPGAQCPFTPPPRPCRDAIVEYINGFFKPIGGVCLTLALLQLIAVMASCAILWKSKDVDKEFDDKDWY